ncbi:MAG TPA: AAA family ATPase [Candidatus Dormibacteraeota bacterium]|nr:AAA family ATPase [Candidatus Dormibacteraeota bacterium]
MLQATNPWWRTPTGWEAADPDLSKLAAAHLRNYRPMVLEGISPSALYLLRGPRRVGKTVVMKHAIQNLIAQGVNPRAIVYVACDMFSRDDLQRVIQVGRDIATRSVGDGSRYWFLDEITSVPKGWAGTIKHLRDRSGFGEDCLVLTGSSARSLRDATKELAGRRRAPQADTDRLLLPMTFRAFCRAIGAATDAPALPMLSVTDLRGSPLTHAVDTLLPWLDELANSWELYLAIGGFPGAVEDYLETGAVGDTVRDDLFQVAYGGAIRERSTFRFDQMTTLLGHLSLGLGNPLNLRRIAAAIGAEGHTVVADRLGDFLLAYLLVECPPMEMDLQTEVLSGMKKWYCVDPLLSRLPHLRDPTLWAAPDPSVLSEQQVGVALLRQREYHRSGSFLDHNLFYVKTTTRKEVDFVAPWMDGIAIEGKYVDTGLMRESATLRAQVASGRFSAGVIATRAVVADLAPRVAAVPAAMLAWLLEPPQ